MRMRSVIAVALIALVVCVAASEIRQQRSVAVRGRHRAAIENTQAEQSEFATLFPAAQTASNDITPLWSYTHPVTVYTSSELAKDTQRIATAGWLSPPYQIEVFDVNGKGTPAWTYVLDPEAPSWEMIEVRVAVAKHATDRIPAAADAVSVAALVYDGAGNFSASVYGFSWTSDKPMWHYTLEKVAVDEVDETTLVFSNDGSTVVVAVAGQVSFMHPPVTMVHVLDAQTGKARWVWTAPASKDPGPYGVTVSADGSFVSVADDTTLYVLDTKNKQIRGTPIQMGFTPAPAAISICPMGHYLVFGFEAVSVYAWDNTKQDYALVMTVSNSNHYSASLAVGEDIVAVGWLEFDTKEFEITTYHANATTPLWTYNGAPTAGQLQENPQKLVMSEGLIAVANWGAENNTSPTVLLFSTASNVPLLAYTTPGSMFDVDVARVGNNAIVTAAGKLVHANIMGSGGQAVAFSVPLPHSERHREHY